MEKYIIQRGDSLWKIASRYNISIEALAAANPQIEDINAIHTGELLYIPQELIPCSDAGGCRCECSRNKQERPFIYTARERETLQDIASAFDLTEPELQACNQQLKPDEELGEGLKILIPGLDMPIDAEELCTAAEAPDMPQKPCENGDCCLCPCCGARLKIMKCE